METAVSKDKSMDSDSVKSPEVSPPPSYSPRGDVDMAESCIVQKQDVRRKQRKLCSKWLGKGGICVCTTILFIAGIVHVMTPAVGGTLACPPLRDTGFINMALGTLLLIGSCCTYSFLFFDSNGDREIRSVCCILTAILVVLFLAISIANSVAVFGNFDVVRSGQYVDEDGNEISCKRSEIPFALAFISYISLALLCSFNVIVANL